MLRICAQREPQPHFQLAACLTVYPLSVLAPSPLIVIMLRALTYYRIIKFPAKRITMVFSYGAFQPQAVFQRLVKL